VKLISTIVAIVALFVATQADAQVCVNCQQPALNAAQQTQAPQGPVYVRGPLGAVWAVPSGVLPPRVIAPATPVRNTWYWLWAPRVVYVK